MKNLKQRIAIGLLTTALGITYACEPKIKKTTTSPIIAQAINMDTDRKVANNTVKIALLLDTSNSMDGLINQAKSQLWDVINKFTYAKCGNESRPELQIALYQYGNDNLSSKEGYIQQVLNFSSDLDEISEKLFSLSTNGGEEYCGEVISTSLKQLDWGKNPDNLKMIFIAGNEPFNQGKLNYKDAVTNAVEKDIIINTIFCGNYDQGINSLWRNGAITSGGEYMAIDHNQHIVHISTPYDAVIIELNKKLNGTYISYGSLGTQKIKAQAVQDNNAYEMEEAVAVKRAVSKSSRLYKNSSWDLVDASDQKDFDVLKIEKKQLPKELKNKSSAEIASFIKTKKATRAKIQKEIREINLKRESYIAKNQKENSEGSLENVMLKAIQKQAAKKNYSWE